MINIKDIDVKELKKNRNKMIRVHEITILKAHQTMLVRAAKTGGQRIDNFSEYVRRLIDEDWDRWVGGLPDDEIQDDA